MTNTVTFIYVWRLDLEKGVDSILQVFKDVLDSDEYTISLDIFGWWSLEGKVQNFSDEYNQVTYHGFQEKPIVLEIRKDMDYCLIPSNFLETFGLTALDSLGVWVPIIAPAKWWLTSFVSDELTLCDCTVSDLKKMLIKAIGLKQEKEIYERLVNQAYEKHALYSYNIRYEKLQSLWLQKQVLLINDYGVNHGWIETLLEEMMIQLKKADYTLTCFVWTNKKLTQLQRYIGLWKTLFNIWAACRLSILQKQAHLVWWHSVHRQLWRLPLFISSWKNTHWIMVHDMWLLHPFPSFVEHESQIKKSRMFTWWIQEWIAAKWLLWLPLIVIKRVCMKLLWRQIELKNMLVQVPSEYLMSHVADRVNECSVVCVPHFVLQ